MNIDKLELEKKKYAKDLEAYYMFLEMKKEEIKQYKSHIEFLEYMIQKIEELENEIKEDNK